MAPVTVEDILRWHRRYGSSTPVGEWGLIQETVRGEYRRILDEEDAYWLEQMFSSCLKQQACMMGMISILSSPRFQRDPRVLQAYLECDVHETWAKHTMSTDLARLEVPDCCEPVYSGVIQGTRILPDTPRHDHYAERITRALPFGGLIVEIGGGYGGLAFQLMRWQPAHRVVLCDLPETLYIAGYWLSRVMPDLVVGWWDEAPDAQIVLLPAQDRDAWQGTPDLVFAAHSLSEFGPAEARAYIDWLRQRAVRYFYHDNAIAKPVTMSGSTVEVFPEVLASDLDPGPPYVERWREVVHWAMSGERYGQFFYEREGV